MDRGVRKVIINLIASAFLAGLVTGAIGSAIQKDYISLFLFVFGILFLKMVSADILKEQQRASLEKKKDALEKLRKLNEKIKSKKEEND
ncbi:MAG: hypothetical protein ACOCRK_04800 [bacterium]